MRRRVFVRRTAGAVVAVGIAYPRQRLFKEDASYARWDESDSAHVEAAIGYHDGPVYVALGEGYKPVSEWLRVEASEMSTVFVAYTGPMATMLLIGLTEGVPCASVPIGALYSNGGDVTVNWSGPKLSFSYA